MLPRERIRLLVDAESFVEDAKLANVLDPELPSDGVVTGTGTIDGRTVAIMANDSTVKAGSWGARTVEKILRIQEVARELQCPLFYLVDSAGALTRLVARQKPGSTVELKVYREGKERDVKVKVGTRPDIEGVFKEEQKGTPEDQRQQKIGLGFRDMDPRYAQGTGLPQKGALIQEVRPGSPAERGGLRPGMVVIEAGNQPVKSANDLAKAVKLLIDEMLIDEKGDE